MKLFKSGSVFVWLVLPISILFFFKDIGLFPIFQWDEARYVNNSLEMLMYGNWFHFTMDGAIDIWNFKPPLVLWFQAFSMKIFGANEFAVRLPSALAGIGITFLLYRFCIKIFKSESMGVASGLFFLASCGFIGPHMGRSADLDAVQTFFVTLYVLFFLRHILSPEPVKNAPYYLGAMILLSFLCKGMPGLLLLPFLVIITFLHGNYKRVFAEKSIFLVALVTILACAGYYFIRNYYTPGYWDLVRKSEFNRFSGKGVEWHVQPFGFYLHNFISLKRYFFLIYFLPASVLILLFRTNPVIKKAVLYLLVISVGYFLFISFPPVKLEWYDAPLYPLFALLLGISVSQLSVLLTKKLPHLGKHKIAITTVISLVLCLPHFVFTWKKIRYSPAKMADFEYPGILIKAVRNSFPNEMYFSVLMHQKKEEHKDQVKFYQKSFLLESGVNIKIVNDFRSLSAGEKVVITEPQLMDSVKLNFPTSRILIESEQGKFVQIR